MGVNKVILLGHVGKDPVVQYVKEDVPVARFTLATTENYRDRDGNRQSTTEWHNLVVWRGLAKVVEQYVRKGSQLFVEGKLTTRSYEKDGQTKYFTEVVVNNLEMLGRAGDTSSSSYNKETNQTSSNQNVNTSSNVVNEPTIDTEEAQSYDETDDLPF